MYSGTCKKIRTLVAIQIRIMYAFNNEIVKIIKIGHKLNKTSSYSKHQLIC